MSNSTHNDETVLNYLDGILPEGEKQAFESRLKTEAALQEELEGLQLAREAVKSYGLKEQVAGIHKEMMQELKQPAPVRKISSFRRIIRYSVAAAASIIVIFLGVQGYNFYQLSPEKLFNDEYKGYDLTVRDNGTASPVEKDFTAKNYKAVVDQVKRNQSPLASQGVTTKDILLSGLSNLELKNSAAAIADFKTVIEIEKASPASGLKEDAEFYLALAYLRNKDYDQAIELMNQLKGTAGHTYQKEFSNAFIRKVRMLKWR
jgi:tetratricopeptide (TPR) repeat protein